MHYFYQQIPHVSSSLLKQNHFIINNVLKYIKDFIQTET